MTQLVSIGFDDNGQVEGIEWALEMLAPRGTATFFVTSSYALADSWRAIHRAGHEIGNHTETHTTARGIAVERWLAEMRACNAYLVDTVGVPADEIRGFRAPYLECDEHTLAAAREAGFAYDTSLEEEEHAWPYLRDGLWELPVRAVIVPPALRATMAARQPWFDVETGFITGFDYNLWAGTEVGGFAMTGDELLATLIHTLEQRVAEGHAPFLFGAHTDYYAASWNQHAPGTPSELDRRAAIEAFLEHARGAELVSHAQVLDRVQSW